MSIDGQSLVLLHVLQAIFLACLTVQQSSIRRAQQTAILTSLGMLVTAIAVCRSVMTAEGQSVPWWLRWSSSADASGMLDAISLHATPAVLPLLLLLPLLSLSLHVWREESTTAEIGRRTCWFAFANLLLLSNDVLTTTGAIVVMACLLRRQDEEGSAGSMWGQIVGWSCFVFGIAWLTATAAMIETAPHGSAGVTTTVYSELVSQVSNARSQHPVAQVLWEQYNGVFISAMLVGVSLVGGCVPLHAAVMQLINRGSMEQRLMTLVTAKLVLLLFYRILVQPDSEAWQTTVQSSVPWVLVAFLYASLLVLGFARQSGWLGALFVWSQQWSLLILFVAPDASAEWIGLTTLTHVAACGLLFLVLDARDTNCNSRKFSVSLPSLELVALCGLAILPGADAVRVMWSMVIRLSTEADRGGLKLCVFVVAALISIAGVAGIACRSTAAAASVTRSRWIILLCWSLVTVVSAILGSRVGMLLISDNAAVGRSL